MTSYSPLSVTTTVCKYYCVYASKCLHTFPFSPTSSTTSYSPLSVTKQGVSYCVYESSLLCLHTFPFSPTSSTTSYSPLSVATTDCKYSCVYASKCLHTFPFSPTSSTTSYAPLQQQDVSILVFMHLCLHTFPFSPTSSTTSYSSLSVTKQRVSVLVFCIYVFIHFLFHLLPPRHHYLSQNRE